MSIPLLETKLFHPRHRSGEVKRPALLARLDEGFDAGVTIISAPAGYGKTSLLAQWITRRSHRIAWVSLDREHRDPSRLLAYIIGAIRTTTNTFGEALSAAVGEPRALYSSAALTTFINEVARLPGRMVLVLDDYHLAHSEEGSELVSYLLDHRPPGLRVVIASRTQPRLPRARLRVSGRLVEIGMSDLRFTAAESSEFLCNVMNLGLSEPDATELARRAEGWIAGLQLAGLALRQRPGVGSLDDVLSGNHRLVFDYLAEEVVDQQPVDVQSFLDQTSILDRMSGPLCDAVLEANAGESQARLEQLERDNVFIVPLDGERHWYRYHHLFSDVLRRRLDRISGAANRGEPQAIVGLHSRASDWFASHGLEAEAFSHAAAAGDVDRAASLIRGGRTPLPYRGAAAPVLEWLSSLPQDVFTERPELRVWFALSSVLLGRTTRVEQQLSAAESALSTDDRSGEPNDALGHVATVRAMLAIASGDSDAMIRHARRALEHLAAPDGAAHYAARFTLGFASHRAGDADAALDAYGAVLDAAVDNLVFRLAASAGRGQVQERLGRLDEAAKDFEFAVELAGQPPLAYACEGHLGLARINYERNDLAQAETHAVEAVRLGTQLPAVDTPAAGHLVLASISLARSHTPTAATHLERARRLVIERKVEILDSDVSACRVRLAIARHDTDELARFLAEPISKHSQALVLLAMSRPEDALDVLQVIDVGARLSVRQQIEVLALRARARAAVGERETAAHDVAEAMARAEAGGFVRVFLDVGGEVESLIESADRSMRIRPRLLEAFDEERRAADRRRPDTGVGIEELLEPLTEIELEVLRLIAQGHSNKEIGRRLFRAVSTIKGHNRSLYAKLRVRSRTEAVARSRQLGLL